MDLSAKPATPRRLVSPGVDKLATLPQVPSSAAVQGGAGASSFCPRGVLPA